MMLPDFTYYRHLITALVFVFFVPVSQAAIPESQADFNNSPLTAENLLQRFVHNGSAQIFDGTFVYFFEDKVQTVKVHRKVNDQGKLIEEFIPMDGQQKKSVRVLKNQFCTLDNHWLYQFQAMSSSFPFRVNNFYKQLQENYSFKLLDMKTVAGLSAVGLSISSKDPYRYGYQLWFEPKTATLLKYKLMDQKGKAIEQYLFTDIKLQNNQTVYNDVEKTTAMASCNEQFQGLTEAYTQFFAADKIPIGYQPVSYRQGYIQNSQRQAHQFQLSDGLSTVSIFIEDSKPLVKSINGVVKLGPVNVVGKTIGQYQVTIIGAIPVISALHFLKAIKLSDKPIEKHRVAHD